MSQEQDFFPQGTRDKQTIATENQVSLDNQFPMILKEGKEGRIAIADIVWPATQDDPPERFDTWSWENYFSISASLDVDVVHKL